LYSGAPTSKLGGGAPQPPSAGPVVVHESQFGSC